MNQNLDKDIGDLDKIKVGDDGSLDVRVQDQTTPSVDIEFAKSITGGEFTLSADTGESTETTLIYIFEATAGHSIIANDFILLLDVAADRALQCKVLSVSTNTITIDRPIDHDFKAATALGRRTVLDMAVNGSVTPQIYTIRAGTIPIDIIRYNLVMTHAASGDDSKFGDQTALTRGLVLRIYDGYNQTIFNFKSNGDMRRFAGSPDVNYSDKAGAGAHSTSARFSFGGDAKHGIVHRVSGTSVIQWIVQDDLTGLTALSIVAQGHKTLEEV